MKTKKDLSKKNKLTKISLGLIITVAFFLITKILVGENAGKLPWVEVAHGTDWTANSVINNYQSLYQYVQPQLYDMVTGTEASAQPYAYYTGFHDQHNLDNSITRCGSSSENCAYNPTYDLFNAVGINGGLIKGTIVPEKFRVFIPPGSKSINITIFVAGASGCNTGVTGTSCMDFAVVARVGQPPTGNYSTSYFANISDEEWGKMYRGEGFSMTENKDKDYLGWNHSGIMSVGSPSKITAEDTGQWVYVEFFPIKGVTLAIQVDNYVDTNIYMDWFRSATWDANGDPTGTSSPTPQPTPQPTPTSTDGVCGTANGQTFSSFPFGN